MTPFSASIRLVSSFVKEDNDFDDVLEDGDAIVSARGRSLWFSTSASSASAPIDVESSDSTDMISSASLSSAALCGNVIDCGVSTSRCISTSSVAEAEEEEEDVEEEDVEEDSENNPETTTER